MQVTSERLRQALNKELKRAKIQSKQVYLGFEFKPETAELTLLIKQTQPSENIGNAFFRPVFYAKCRTTDKQQKENIYRIIDKYHYAYDTHKQQKQAFSIEDKYNSGRIIATGYLLRIAGTLIDAIHKTVAEILDTIYTDYNKVYWAITDESEGERAVFKEARQWPLENLSLLKKELQEIIDQETELNPHNQAAPLYRLKTELERHKPKPEYFHTQQVNEQHILANVEEAINWLDKKIEEKSANDDSNKNNSGVNGNLSDVQLETLYNNAFAQKLIDHKTDFDSFKAALKPEPLPPVNFYPIIWKGNPPVKTLREFVGLITKGKGTINNPGKLFVKHGDKGFGKKLGGDSYQNPRIEPNVKQAFKGVYPESELEKLIYAVTGHGKF